MGTETHLMDAQEEIRKLKRETNRVGEAMAAQRETMTRALQEVQTTLLEQELTLRAHLGRIDHVLDALGGELGDHEERLRKLEGKPPAA